MWDRSVRISGQILRFRPRFYIKLWTLIIFLVFSFGVNRKLEAALAPPRGRSYYCNCSGSETPGQGVNWTKKTPLHKTQYSNIQLLQRFDEGSDASPWTKAKPKPTKAPSSSSSLLSCCRGSVSAQLDHRWYSTCLLEEWPLPPTPLRLFSQEPFRFLTLRAPLTNWIQLYVKEI